MRFFLRGILFLVVGLLLLQVDCFAISQANDSTKVQQEIIAKKHSPSKATMFTAVLPGLGQIYNKRYWKVPFVWGGFAGLGYMINYQNVKYNRARNAYFDLNDNNQATKSNETYFPGYSSENLLKVIDSYRNQRDRYMLISAGFYLLTILDANVDAHFIDFDISQDLTLSFNPFITEPISNTPVIGAHITFTF